MSNFNTYVQQVNDVAQATFEEIQKTETAYKNAEAKYNANKRPAHGVWNTDAATIAKYARIEADYHEAKNAYDTMRRTLPEQKTAEIAQIRSNLEKAVNDFYAAKPEQLDANVMELLKSGILKPAEYARLMDAADQADNATMVRIIAQYAENAAANAKDEDAARALRAVGYKGRNVSGKPYMENFDVMADCFQRCMRNTAMIKLWDELTGNIRNNF